MPRDLTPSELIEKLQRRQVRAAAEMRDRLKRAQKRVAVKIERLAEQRAAATSKKARDQLFRELTSIYEVQAAEIDAWMQELAEQTALEWHNQAVKEMRTLGKGKVAVAFSRDLVRRTWEIIRPANAKYLAAVFTDQMSGSDKRHLRNAFLDTFRQQRLEGWTARETTRELQSKWDRLARNLRSDRFVDSAGRRWPNADYLNMLSRTTFARVQDEATVDAFTQAGYSLARIVDDGEPCDVCRAWAGLIIDISGNQNTHYPSRKQAIDAGWKHPRCGCYLEFVSPALDKTEMDRQQSQPAVDWGKPKQVQEYNDDIRVREKRDAGMTAAEAEQDLKRDKLKRELQVAHLGQHTDVVDKIPPAVLDRIPRDRLPRFELVKQGDLEPGETGRNRTSSRGGVIRIVRGPDSSGDEVGRHLRLAFAKTALDDVGDIRDARGRLVKFSHEAVYHWERKDKSGNVKATADIDGRIAALDRAVNAVRTGEARLVGGSQRAYTEIDEDGKHGVAVFVGKSGAVKSWLPTSTRRNIRRWLEWPKEN